MGTMAHVMVKREPFIMDAKNKHGNEKLCEQGVLAAIEYPLSPQCDNYTTGL